MADHEHIAKPDKRRMSEEGGGQKLLFSFHVLSFNKEKWLD